jgi:hypothetical protein
MVSKPRYLGKHGAEKDMPVEHQHTIKAGSTQKLLFVYASDEREPGIGKEGLANDVSTAIVAFAREGESAAHRVSLTGGRLGEWSAGSFVEVDPDLMPGVYQLGLPDEMLAPGSTRAILCVRFPGALITPVEVSLVAFDPQDAERIGVWGLANHKRHEFLRRALPRLTEMELALGEEAEGTLRKRLAERKEE